MALSPFATTVWSSSAIRPRSSSTASRALLAAGLHAQGLDAQLALKEDAAAHGAPGQGRQRHEQSNERESEAASSSVTSSAASPPARMMKPAQKRRPSQ